MNAEGVARENALKNRKELSSQIKFGEEEPVKGIDKEGQNSQRTKKGFIKGRRRLKYVHEF